MTPRLGEYLPDIRLPLEPLLEIAQKRYRPESDRDHVVGPTGVLANVLGISFRTAHRYRRHGLTIDQADRAACELGLHASNIWTNWYEIGHDS